MYRPGFKFLTAAGLAPFMAQSEKVQNILNNNSHIKNECSDMKHHMEEEAANLDKIFSESGTMLDG